MNQKLDFFTSYVTEAPRLMHTGGDKKKKKVMKRIHGT